MMNRDLIRRIQSSSERSTPCKFSLSYNNYSRLSVPACIGFGGRHWQPVCSAPCVADAGFRTPWLLATSLPVTRTLARQVVRLYRLRMSIEEGFRDMKSHQFGLGLTYHRCASVERLQVLVFIASLALLVLWLVGAAMKAAWSALRELPDAQPWAA